MQHVEGVDASFDRHECHSRSAGTFSKGLDTPGNFFFSQSAACRRKAAKLTRTRRAAPAIQPLTMSSMIPTTTERTGPS
jgi:hypothetical protein